MMGWSSFSIARVNLQDLRYWNFSTRIECCACSGWKSFENIIQDDTSKNHAENVGTRSRWKAPPLNEIRWRAVLSHATAEGAMTRSKTTIIKVPKTKNTPQKHEQTQTMDIFFLKNGSDCYRIIVLNDRNDETLMYID